MIALRSPGTGIWDRNQRDVFAHVLLLTINSELMQPHNFPRHVYSHEIKDL